MEPFPTIQALAEAVEGGEFEENHYLEAKASCDLASKAAKIELARDMAQFAIDGGTLVIGVAEDKDTNSFSLCPGRFHLGVVEQIEQIAQTRCQPPLSVRVRKLPTVDDAERGALVISVPASTRAPHMVDGKYPARGEATRRYLTDTEVRLMVSKSEDAETTVQILLDEWVVADPFTNGDPRTAHLFGIAVPLTSRQDEPVAREAAWGILAAARSRHADALRGRFHRGDMRSRAVVNASLEALTRPRQRAEGWSFQSSELGELDPDDAATAEERLAEWELVESGTIRMYDAGLSAHHGTPSGRVHAAWPGNAVDVAGVLVQSAALWSTENDYNGEWGLGLAATGMRGTRADPMSPSSGFPVVDRDRCDRIVLTSSQELAADAGPVLDQLVRSILNTFGDPDRIKP